jgi:hypothetical protein
MDTTEHIDTWIEFKKLHGITDNLGKDHNPTYVYLWGLFDGMHAARKERSDPIYMMGYEDGINERQA